MNHELRIREESVHLKDVPSTQGTITWPVAEVDGEVFYAAPFSSGFVTRPINRLPIATRIWLKIHDDYALGVAVNIEQAPKGKLICYEDEVGEWVSARAFTTGKEKNG